MKISNINSLSLFQQTFRGAARLTYGQHPENDNDHTTTTTTTTQAPTTQPSTTEAATVPATSEKQEQETVDDSTEEVSPLTSDSLTNNGQRRSLTMKNDVSLI